MDEEFLIFPDLVEEIAALELRSVVMDHPDMARGYVDMVSAIYLPEDDRNSPYWFHHPLVWLPVMIVDYGFPLDVASRCIVKAAKLWPLEWPEWYGVPDSELYWTRMTRIGDEMCSRARIASRRQGLPLYDRWNEEGVVTVALPGLWSWSMEYLDGLSRGELIEL